MTHSAHGSDLLNHAGGPVPSSEGTRFGFFTDTSVCIGCKACEVACKEWNQVPERDETGFTGTSMDNTGQLGADSWRHVAFVEQPAKPDLAQVEQPAKPDLAQVEQPAKPAGRVGLEWFGDDPGLPAGAHGADLPPAATALAPGPDGMYGEVPHFHGAQEAPGADTFRWLMSSDVCKHCTNAACLEVCPTGAIFYTEFDTVVVQDDVCNGCGYCVTACPYGVIERRSPGKEGGGGAFKCTMCYDRMRGHEQPACARACPTDSIQFGPLDELRERAQDRVEFLIEAGVPGAQLYGADPDDGVGGNGAFFLLLDDPEVYRLPPDPVTPTRNLPQIWRWAGVAAAGVATVVAAAFAGERGR
ncbi:4Fe-4S dicluster domain-containing protein [Nitriliruptoraceae bacterium ZYF776]|nr:4Fe-4S dicluster domain-containing protein [Profundirhabdus halotolerans]